MFQHHQDDVNTNQLHLIVACFLDAIVMGHFLLAPQATREEELHGVTQAQGRKHKSARNNGTNESDESCKVEHTGNNEETPCIIITTKAHNWRAFWQREAVCWIDPGMLITWQD